MLVMSFLTKTGFNTCSSCEEQPDSSVPCCADCVSIHAPLARSNKSAAQLQTPHISFNTCSSCEEQHLPCVSVNSSIKFQYMLLLRGATHIVVHLRLHLSRFNTCSSCEEQHSPLKDFLRSLKFQYMLLLRGATWRLRRVWRNYNVSIHAPLARSN